MTVAPTPQDLTAQIAAEASRLHGMIDGFTTEQEARIREIVREELHGVSPPSGDGYVLFIPLSGDGRVKFKGRLDPSPPSAQTERG